MSGANPSIKEGEPSKLKGAPAMTNKLHIYDTSSPLHNATSIQQPLKAYFVMYYINDSSINKMISSGSFLRAWQQKVMIHLPKNVL